MREYSIQFAQEVRRPLNSFVFGFVVESIALRDVVILVGALIYFAIANTWSMF